MAGEQVRFCEGCPIAGSCTGDLSMRDSLVAESEYMYKVWLGDTAGNVAETPINFEVAVDYTDSVMGGEAVAYALNHVRYCDGLPKRRLLSPAWWPKSLGELGIQGCGVFPGQIPRRGGMNSDKGLVGGDGGW